MLIRGGSALVVKEFINESLLGNKGICKVNKVWLGLAVFSFLNANEGSPPLPSDLLGIILAVTCWSLTGFWINDLADEQVDALAGRKPSSICLFARYRAIALIGIVALIGIGCVLMYSGSSGAILSYTLALAIGYAYSIEPVRFKDREKWGLWAFTLCVVLACVLFPWFWIRSSCISLILILSMVFCDEWIKIYGHEVQDYQDDFSSLSKTHVVALGLERAQKTLRIQAHIAFAVLCSGLFLVGYIGGRSTFPAIVLTWLGALASAIYGGLARSQNPPYISLVRSLPLSYLGLSYATSRILPVLLLVQMTWKSWYYSPILLWACLLIAIETWNWNKLAQPRSQAEC